ncbi:leucine efflux protein LeuE [Salininema proteolyticum]|uniref:Leucine efflux protein LeuE n=1 Tax=Salininema proteolyticum TaxID=1607685 RepID=A0ABV8TUX8_9ACTN
MFGIVDIWTYLAAAVLVILLPGPNSLYVLSVATRRGRKAGFTAASGVVLGDFILIVLTVTGLASMFAAAPLLYNIVRWAGVLYLAWLAVGLMRSAWTTVRKIRAGEVEAEAPADTGKRERPFVRALVASLLNPKAILFFVAFFVQFVDPGYEWTALSYLILGVIVQLLSVTYLTTLIIAGDSLATAFRSRRRLAATGTGLVGAVMMAFAAKLAVGV